METVCKICGCPLLDDQNIARDNFGVNLEVHADCLAALTPASDGRAEGLREAAEIARGLCVMCGGSGFHPGNYLCASVVCASADAILARAAELEKADG